MEACATRWGPDIRRAFGNRIELAILLGSLLGERPANGRTRRWRNVTEKGKIEAMSKDGRFRIDL